MNTMDRLHDFDIPTRADVPTGWTAATLGDRWRWTLTDAQIDELVRAGHKLDIHDHKAVSALHLHPPTLNTFTNRLDRLRQNLLDGIGFELISGLPVDELGDDVATAAMLTLSAHLGSLRQQNADGDLVGHVRNIGLDSADPNVRVYQTSERQTFHTDSTDVVGLLALAKARQGGESLVISANAVYHAVAERHGDLVDELFSPVATDRRGETPEGHDPWFTIPVFTWWDERLTVRYQRQYIDSANRFPDAPRPSERQIAAFDAFDDACNDRSLHARMDLDVGDIQFVHNHSILHDRTAFVDNAERPRHLIRTWMSVAGDRQLHPVFAQRFGSIIPGDRGGILDPTRTLQEESQ